MPSRYDGRPHGVRGRRVFADGDPHPPIGSEVLGTLPDGSEQPMYWSGTQWKQANPASGAAGLVDRIVPVAPIAWRYLDDV